MTNNGIMLCSNNFPGSCVCTWFLNNSIAGVGYLLPFGLVWVLVVVEVAINSRGVTLIKLISLHKDDVNKAELLLFVMCAAQPSQY